MITQPFFLYITLFFALSYINMNAQEYKVLLEDRKYTNGFIAEETRELFYLPKKSLPSGIYNFYYDSAMTRIAYIGVYKNDSLSKCSSFSFIGKLESIRIYYNGRLERSIRYFENLKKWTEDIYGLDSLKIHYRWDSTGQLVISSLSLGNDNFINKDFKNGILLEESISYNDMVTIRTYYPNGKLKKITNYIKNSPELLDGIQRSWNANGILLEEKIYSKGKLILKKP